MIITQVNNIITLELDTEELETFNYMKSVSSVMFRNYMIKLFTNRKRQQEHDLKQELTRTMTREELKTEIEKRR